MAAEQWLIRQALDADSHPGWFVEVGAHHPTRISQTWHLAQARWTGLLIEPQPDLAQLLRDQRPESQVEEVACGGPGGPTTAVLRVPAKTGHATLDESGVAGGGPETSRIVVEVSPLDTLLERHAPERIDCVSIDVEGYTTQVLDGFDIARWRPRLLLIEDHMLDWSVHRHPSIRRAGYRLVKRTGMNNWYVGPDWSTPVAGAGERRRLQLKMLRTPTRRLSQKIRRAVRTLRSRA